MSDNEFKNKHRQTDRSVNPVFDFVKSASINTVIQSNTKYKSVD